MAAIEEDDAVGCREVFGQEGAATAHELEVDRGEGIPTLEFLSHWLRLPTVGG